MKNIYCQTRMSEEHKVVRRVACTFMQRGIICLGQGRYVFLPVKLLFVCHGASNTKKSLIEYFHYTITHWVKIGCSCLLDAC